MAKVTITVCDKCGAQEDVKHFEVKEGLRRAVMDLCGDDSKMLDQLLGEAPAAAQKPRATRTRARKVTTMEEIEAMKKK